ncbi:MAG TPA: PAS domain-containing sensor histidine kinase [Thermodesulfobacteriota bacterium]
MLASHSARTVKKIKMAKKTDHGLTPPASVQTEAQTPGAAAQRPVDDRPPAAGFRQSPARTSVEVRPDEGWFRLLVERIRDYAIFLLDPEGRVATWNAGAERIKGYRADEIIGRHFSCLYLPDDVEAGKPGAMLEAAARDGRVEDEGWRLRKDGSVFWASVVITPLRDQDGRLLGFGKVTRDLTERRRKEAEVRAANVELARRADDLTAANRQLETLSLLVSSVVDYAIFVLDPAGRVVTWNIGAERIKGYRADEIIGRHFSRFYPPEDVEAGKPAMELREASAHGSFEDEGWRVRKDGSRFWANVVITALRDAEGRPVGFAKVTRDLTERKQAEEHRIQLAIERKARSEAEAAVQMRDEFLSIASHELKTPLTPLLLQMQILLRGLRAEGLASYSPERLVSIIESAERQARRFAALVEQLLEVSRIAAGRLELEPEEVDLAEVARSVALRFDAEIARSGSPFTLALDGPVIGRWDRLRLEQVIVNLLSNAIKYGAGQPIELRVDRQDETARLVVRDRGIGIDPADQERIFRRFERAAPSRAYAGLGMGLYVVRQIVEAHGGSVRVASAPGAGTAFTVELPRDGAEPAAAVAS